MDYSVGSLADLISGSNTPNKPKVIKKTFKKPKHVEDTNDEKNIKKSFKKNVVPKNESTVPKLKRRLKEVKNDTNKVKKGIKKSLKNGPGKGLPNSNCIQDSENIKRRIHKKRKFETSESDSTAEAGSPKKPKINQNEYNAERRIKKTFEKEDKKHDPEESERTVFVGNVPISFNKKNLKKHFNKYGEIDTVRVRGIPVADLKTSKKVAAIRKEFNPKRSNVFCYIRFVDKESAIKAEAENGSLFEGHHLRVHCCTTRETPDETKAIFVGNLSFNAVEDELWKLFETCGPISHVRIIRDSHTGMGKGFGYVNFKDSDAVQLALEMENVKLNDRELRISLCNLRSARKKNNHRNTQQITQPRKQKPRKKFNKPKSYENNDSEQVDTYSQGIESSGSNKISQPEGISKKNVSKQSNKEEGNRLENKIIPGNAKFQGTKFSDKNKKRKVNKGLLEKKKLVKKIAPKPK